MVLVQVHVAHVQSHRQLVVMFTRRSRHHCRQMTVMIEMRVHRTAASVLSARRQHRPAVTIQQCSVTGPTWWTISCRLADWEWTNVKQSLVVHCQCPVLQWVYVLAFIHSF